MQKDRAPDLVARLGRVDGVIALAFQHGEDAPPCASRARYFDRMPSLALTLETSRLEVATRMPLALSCSWREVWANLLPELGLADDAVARAAVGRDAMQLFVADAAWGRPRWLFGVVRRALSPP